MAAPKKKIDWDWIEPLWRANVKSVLQIAAEYEEKYGRSISHTAINKHFKKLGIKRDLKAKVKAKADSMVSEAMVSGKVSTETDATDAEIINAEALSVAQVQFHHRVDIPKKRELVAKLFAEVEALTDGGDVIEKAKEYIETNDLQGFIKSMEKVSSLPTRIKGVSDLVNAYKSLIGLERQAYNIDDQIPDGEDSRKIEIEFVSP